MTKSPASQLIEQVAQGQSPRKVARGPLTEAPTLDDLVSEVGTHLDGVAATIKKMKSTSPTLGSKLTKIQSDFDRVYRDLMSAIGSPH